MPPRRSALVTGAASGIGRALSLELARRGYSVTVADRDRDGVEAVVSEIERRGGEALAVTCDVLDTNAQQAMYDQHTKRFSGLNAVCLNAGVLEKVNAGNLLGKNEGQWEVTLNIDLKAQIVGTRLAVQTMQATGSKGVIMFTASAGGIWAMPEAPVYAAAKAGLVNFALSIAPQLSAKGIRVCCLCPQVVDTPLTTAALQKLEKKGQEAGTVIKFGNANGKMLGVEQVVKGAIYLLEDESKRGTVLIVHSNGKMYEHSFHNASLRTVDPSAQAARASPPELIRKEALQQWVSQRRPKTRKKIQVHRLSSDFRKATRVVEEPIPDLKPNEVLVRRMYAGVNASDVNFTSGRYSGDPKTAADSLPFDAGFEAVGVVAAVGSSVKGINIGDAAAEMVYGAYSDWGVCQASRLLRVQTCAPQIVALLTSGLTASIGLEAVGQMATGETVLVTAAAGGTGQFAVQLAKAAGNHVVATCGGREKARLLQRLGADRVVNYREESLKEVLKQEYKQGINLIWETVGGDMFNTCLRALAPKGRLIVVGMMSQYSSGWEPLSHRGLPELLLARSASVRGFFLLDYARLFKPHLQALTQQWMQGKLIISLDPKSFVGVERAADAVEHLQTGNSIGKVVLQLPVDLPGSKAPNSRL